MARVAYVNGRYLPLRDASVNVEDRGYQFADGVYEVCEVRDRHLIDESRHMARLHRSLTEIRIAMPVPQSAMSVILRETVRRNRISDGLVYVQVTRGVARRDHAFPIPSTAPALVVTARAIDRQAGERSAAAGIAVMTTPDIRWARVDIKTIGLLPNVLARQAAREQGAREAWFVDDAGFVTEGAATNAWIVTADGMVVTRAISDRILAGITRAVVHESLAELGLKLEERPFTVKEACAAAEAFVTAATQIVMPVIAIDGVRIGNGKPGPVAAKLRGIFHRFAQAS